MLYRADRRRTSDAVVFCGASKFVTINGTSELSSCQTKEYIVPWIFLMNYSELLHLAIFITKLLRLLARPYSGL